METSYEHGGGGVDEFEDEEDLCLHFGGCFGAAKLGKVGSGLVVGEFVDALFDLIQLSLINSLFGRVDLFVVIGKLDAWIPPNLRLHPKSSLTE